MGTYLAKNEDLNGDGTSQGEKTLAEVSRVETVTGDNHNKEQHHLNIEKRQFTQRRRSSEECLPPRPQRKKSPSLFPSSSGYPSLRRLALKNRTNAIVVPALISESLEGEMSFFPTESPVYGGGQMKVTFGPGATPPEEDSELFLVFEGNTRRHITSAKRCDYATYSAIIPGHDVFEAVTVTVCLLPNGCTTSQLRVLAEGSFVYMPDSTFYLTQFLISSVWDPDSLDNPARIKGENFNLCEENFSSLDCRLTCAFKHIEHPPSWKIVTDSPRIDQNPPPRETLLHFAARFGLKEFAEHLLEGPGCDVALKLPNKDGDLAVELARTSGLDDLADRMLEQSLNEDSGQKHRRLDHVEGKACVIKRHYPLSTATITTKLDETNSAIEDNIQMLRDVVSYMEADEEDSSRSTSLGKPVDHKRFGRISPDHGLSDSSCSDEDEDDEDEFHQRRGNRGTLETVLEDSIQHIQTIHHNVQAQRKENRMLLLEGARRESLARFSTSCPLLTEDKPEVEGWKQKMPSHPSAVNPSDDDDEEEDDDLDDLGKGSSITSPLSPKTPPIQIQVNDISLDSGEGGGVGVANTEQDADDIIPTIPSHVVSALATATNPEDSSPEDGDGARPDDGSGSMSALGMGRGDEEMEDDMEQTRRYSWGPEPDDTLRVGDGTDDSSGALLAASRSKSLMNLDVTGKDMYGSRRDSKRGSRRDSSATKSQNEGYGLDGAESSLLEDSALNAASSSFGPAHSSSGNAHITPVVRRQKRNALNAEQRQQRSASMYDTSLSSENEESVGLNSLSAEHRRQARLSLTEFLADPRNFADDNSGQQSNNQMEPVKGSVLRKLSFLKVGGQRREKKEKKERDREKEEKKEREREKEKIKDSVKQQQHHFVNSSFSNSTKCNYCEKPLQNKPALQCQICYANVHNSSCKDNLAQCTRLTKHPKSLSKVTGNAMREKLKGGGGLGYSQSMREKTRPNTIINSSKSFQPMPFQQQGSSPDVRSPLSTAGTIDENEENDGGLGSPPKTGPGNNNINFSTESLDEVGASETLDFMEDDDLVTQGPEPESWSVTAEKKTLKKMSSKEIKRQDVIFEFIKTEKHHLRTLKIMQKIFSYGMQNELHMDQGLIKKVFPMLDEIVDIASKFNENLQRRQKEAEVVERIGDILVDQFDGDNGSRMELAYGCLCSQQNEAKAVYKDLTKTDKRFQAFIKKCSTNALCRRWTIPECILSVSSRLTKYQLLIEAIIKPSKATKADKEDVHELTKALNLVKSICHSVNLQVQERERWQRLMEIYNKTDARSTGQLKSGKKFRKSDLLQNRKLCHEGELYWKNARAKLCEVHGVLLTDVLLLLTENNGKYTFASQDNKPAVIPLLKLMVREVAVDQKNLYLISQHKAGPEMYEVMCMTEHARKEWKNKLLEAIDKCPAEDEGVEADDVPEVDNEEEMRKEAEARAVKIETLLQLMDEKDKELNKVISDKLKLMGELTGLVSKEDSLGSLKIPVISEQETHLDQTRDLILAAMKEAHLLTRSMYASSTGGLSRSASSVGERVNHGSAALPRRAETFSGFDSSQNGVSNKKRLVVIQSDAAARSSSFPNLMGSASEQLAAFTPPLEAQEASSEGDLDTLPTLPTSPNSSTTTTTITGISSLSTTPAPSEGGMEGVMSPGLSPSHRPTRERDMSLPVTGRSRNSEASRRRAFTLTGGVELPSGIPESEMSDLPEGPIPADMIERISESPAPMEYVNAATQILEHLNSLLKITCHQDTAFQTVKTQLLETQKKLEQTKTASSPSPSPTEKRRNSPPQLRTEPAGQDNRGSNNRMQANGEKPGRASPLSSSLSMRSQQTRPSNDGSRPSEYHLNRIAYGDMIPSQNSQYLQEASGDPSARNRDLVNRMHSAPSPRMQEKRSAHNSTPNISPGRGGTDSDSGGEKQTLVSSASASSLVRRNVPAHLLSTTNQMQVSGGGVRQQLPLKLSKSMSSSNTNASSVTQMLPKKLESLSAMSSSSSKPNKNANAQPQQPSDSDVIFF